MNKVQLAHRLAKRLHITDHDSIGYLNALSEEVGMILASGETITIQNFGVFAPWHQTARPGRNPKDGSPHDVPARTSVKFKPGKLMLERLNQLTKVTGKNNIK